MGNLVQLWQGKEPRISTFLIWEGFGYTEHRALKKVIFKHKSLFEEKGALISTTVVAEIQKKNPQSVVAENSNLITATVVAENKKKGRPDESYLLNERQFILLVMLAKNTPQSVELKNRIEVEFNDMRQKLAALSKSKLNAEWQEVRTTGKQVYMQKSDTIKLFVDYAKSQGSQSAERYYTNLAQMENKALFLLEQKFPNVREVLNVKQLMQVATADQIVEKALLDGMNDKLNYKDIYVLAKDRVVQFSNIMGKSQVIAITEQKRLGVAA